MNRRTLLIGIGLVVALTACGTPQTNVPAAPVQIAVTIYPQATRPVRSPIILISAPAATPVPDILPPAQPTAVAAMTEVAPTEMPMPTSAPDEQTTTPIIFVPVADGTTEGARQELLGLHNVARAEQGLPPFTINAALQQAAQAHAEWLAQMPLQTLWSLGSMAHFGPNNTSYVDRISAAGYATTANRMNENFGAFDSAQSAFDWWMHDPAGAPTHRPQILSPLYTEIGIGVVKHPSGMSYVFIIDFGAR